jgi:hypothetical protein
MHQGSLAPLSRPVARFVKENEGIRQGVFLKVLHLFPKVLSSFSRFFFMKKTAYYGLFQGINNKNHIILKKNVTGFIFYSYFCGNYDIGIKGAC